MLTLPEQSRLREKLVTERTRLLRNAQQGLARSMDRDQDIGRDSIDECTQENLVATELRLRDREKWLLAKIDRAIERIDGGTVDACEDCGEAIGVKRLLARPVTTLCIDCKEAREREEVAYESGGGRGLAGGVGIGGDDLGDLSLPEE
ncbi:MAG: TraR/DksA C4-type zinc finger protein [Myxococcota bacterium]